MPKYSPDEVIIIIVVSVFLIIAAILFVWHEKDNIANFRFPTFGNDETGNETEINVSETEEPLFQYIPETTPEVTAG